jgi:3,4-dihydroxy 2-butanone 4-phosphate synthase/GTP cyclohydrolase II
LRSGPDFTSAVSAPRNCKQAILVRVHTRCTAGDIFAADCHCREILDQSMRMIAEKGCGVVLYLHNASRGFEIEHAPATASASPTGETASSEATPGLNTGRLVLHQELRAREGAQARSGRILRDIGLGSQILSDLGIRRIRLLSNTPMHFPALKGFDLEIIEQVPIPLEKSHGAE